MYQDHVISNLWFCSLHIPRILEQAAHIFQSAYLNKIRHFRIKQTDIAQILLRTRPGINEPGPVGSLRCAGVLRESCGSPAAGPTGEWIPGVLKSWRAWTRQSSLD